MHNIWLGFRLGLAGWEPLIAATVFMLIIFSIIWYIYHQDNGA